MAPVDPRPPTTRSRSWGWTMGTCARCRGWGWHASGSVAMATPAMAAHHPLPPIIDIFFPFPLLSRSPPSPSHLFFAFHRALNLYQICPTLEESARIRTHSPQQHCDNIFYWNTQGNIRLTKPRKNWIILVSVKFNSYAIWPELDWYRINLNIVWYLVA